MVLARVSGTPPDGTEPENAWPALRAGKIEQLIHVAVVSHHLIEFTGDCLRGAGESSFYAPLPAASTRTAAAV